MQRKEPYYAVSILFENNFGKIALFQVNLMHLRSCHCKFMVHSTFTRHNLCTVQPPYFALLYIANLPYSQYPHVPQIEQLALQLAQALHKRTPPVRLSFGSFGLHCRPRTALRMMKSRRMRLFLRVTAVIMTDRASKTIPINSMADFR